MASEITCISRFFILVLFSISLVCSNARNLSKQDYLELRRELQIIKKPAVKSIKTEYGDIFDCVDIYKQPAFDHPLLKNHTIQYGTVSYDKGPLHGTQVTMNVWGPVLSDHSQFSLAQLWIVNGPEDQLNTIEAGWTADPLVFGDALPRLFVFWTADGYKNTGCYNLGCPGFVHVSTDIALGSVIRSPSTYNGDQQEATLKAFKDPTTGNWWLTIGDNNMQVGYWPKSIFTSLADSASTIEWGGEVATPPGVKGPQMGSGHFPDEGFRKACYMKRMQYVDNTNAFRDIPNVSLFQDVPCYKVIDGGNGPGDWGRHIFFGGPGGC